jgi:hypothetical protein
VKWWWWVRLIALIVLAVGGNSHTAHCHDKGGGAYRRCQFRAGVF